MKESFELHQKSLTIWLAGDTPATTARGPNGLIVAGNDHAMQNCRSGNRD
jgi:hypothetical protein